MYTPKLDEFSEFNLINLLTTCFGFPSDDLRIAILIDLPELDMMKDHSFLGHENFSVQSYAVDKFLNPLKGEVGYEYNVKNVDMYAFKTTYGSNLDPEDDAMDVQGNLLSLESDVYPNYDLILAITDYSLTAPLTAKAKEYNFRGATLHGLNQTILNSGLSVDYNKISRQAEVFREVLTKADFFELCFEINGTEYSLKLHCNGQEAQKSHGLCPPGKPDVANLPAGEVYFVPESAEGSFPFRFKDGTIAELIVEKGRIIHAKFLSGDIELVESRNKQLAEDPATGIIGELGFGTQLLPFSGKDIQDEKIFGTCHVATGRSDHLGGNLTPDLFNSKMNASHDDILYAPPKTPEIIVSSVKMQKGGEEVEVFANYEPTDWLLQKISSVYPVEKFSVLV
ncbi:MAG: hypothetical protein VXZ32_01060 [Verrucomicrobiota bacterium]|nr:hypothetical protein [Verrucomicrobiota bacterium]